MPDQFTLAVKEYLRAKVEQRARGDNREGRRAPAPQVINIMDALKKSVQAKGRTKVRAVVGKRIGPAAPKQVTPPVATTKPSSRRTAH
jgi:non-homologous end joining protein Ku